MSVSLIMVRITYQEILSPMYFKAVLVLAVAQRKGKKAFAQRLKNSSLVSFSYRMKVVTF